MAVWESPLRTVLASFLVHGSSLCKLLHQEPVVKWMAIKLTIQSNKKTTYSLFNSLYDNNLKLTRYKAGIRVSSINAKVTS